MKCGWVLKRVVLTQYCNQELAKETCTTENKHVKTSFAVRLSFYRSSSSKWVAEQIERWKPYTLSAQCLSLWGTAHQNVPKRSH